MIRPFRSLHVLALLGVAFAFAPCLSRAQTPTGTPPFGSFGGGPDIINLANLNAHFTIPILQKSGRGLNFDPSILYDTSIWRTLTSGSTTTWTPVDAVNWGWSGSDVLIGPVRSSITVKFISCTGHTGVLSATYTNWAYYDGLGTPHPFPGTSQQSNACLPTTGFTSTATDGSGYTITVSGQSVTNLVSADGKLIVPNTSIQDRNGNKVTLSGSQYVDTLGTTALTTAGTGTPASPKTFTYTAPSGASAAYTIKYTAQTLQTKFGCNVTDYGPTANNLVSEIDLPDYNATTNPNSRYIFAYEVTPGDTHSPHYVTGRLASVTLPTGGTITYTYTGGSTGHITCADGSASGYTRQTPDGTWTYARTMGSGAASTTTITDPQGNQTVIQFQGIYETQRKVYQGSTSGTLLRTVNTCYNGAASPCTGTAITLPISSRTVLDQIGASGPTCKHVYDYNTFGLLTEQDDYDYSTGTPTTILRKEVIAYASLGNGIVDRPSSTSIQNGASTTIAQTSFTYDENTPTATSGTPQHIAITGSRGNPTTVTQLVRTGVTLTSHSTYFDTGTVSTSTDVNGAVTTFVYGSASCGNSFPTSISEPLSMSRSFAWSCPGGVQTSVTDENGKVTSTTWNDTHFWRPAAINFPDSGQTSITYNSATSVTSTTKMNSSQNIVGTVLLDTLGRKKQSQLADPQGMDFVDTTYDALGRVATVTNPHRSTASTSDGTTTYAYDALSRPTSVTLQDGSKSLISYSNNTVTATDPAGKARKSVYDSLSRTPQVFEDPAGLNYETDYTYDALGNLLTVQQKGGSTSSANWRTRTFAYDGLSRLTSESTQEAGNITYGYDASGHAGNLTSRVAPAPNQTGSTTVTTTYTYDLLHRLTQKSYSDGTTPTAHFVYDTPVTWSNPTATTTNVVGRLSEAYVDTCPAAGGNEIFGYDVMGRVTLNNQSTPLNCGSGNWQLLYTYDLAGDMTTYTNGIGKTLTQSFDTAGRVTQLSSSYVDANHPATLATVDSSLGFYPTGALRKITYGNGLTGTAAIEARLQPCRINLNSTGSVITDGCADGAVSGTIQDFFYAFGTSGATNNGNVTIMNAGGMQNFDRTFTFDSLNRLGTMSDAHTSNSCLGLQWTYDPWGNRTAQSVTAGTCGTFSAAINTRNQLIGPPYAYDAAGNLTADGNHTYAYDAENRLISVDGGNTASYLYDALGYRVRKNTSAGSFDYIHDLAGNVVSEQYINVGGFTGWGAGHIYFNGGLLAEYNLSATPTVFVHGDHLGSTRLMTTMSQSIYDNMDFLPFGEQITGASGSNHKFTGDERDSETSLDHTWFRQYSSQLGRWMTPDPAGLAAVDASNPQSWNRYSYALNNSMNLVDPSGLGSCAGLTGKTFFACLSLLGQQNSQSCIDPQSGISAPCNLSGTGWDEFDLMNIPVLTEEGWIPWPASGATAPEIISGAGTLGTPAYYWGQLQVGTGFDLFSGNSSWWGTFGQTFLNGVLHGVRQPGQSFSACVNQNISNTTGGTVNPQKLATTIPATAVGLAGALMGKVPFNIPFDPGTGGISAFTASAFGLGRALGVGGTAMGGLVGAANGVGYGLAIAGAATAGLVVGSAINCR